MRLFVPLLDGTDRVGVLAFTLDAVDDHDRRLARRLAGLVADILVTKSMYTDRFFQARRRQPMSPSAEMLDVGSGLLQWVNAGHPAPLLLRGHRVVAALDSPTTLPVGFGGATPVVTERALEPGDRVLFFTDGLIEEHHKGGEEFGETRLRDLIERAGLDGGPVQETVRRLSHSLMLERGGVTTDDATLLLLEWRGETADDLAIAEGSGQGFPASPGQEHGPGAPAQRAGSPRDS